MIQTEAVIQTVYKKVELSALKLLPRMERMLQVCPLRAGKMP